MSVVCPPDCIERHVANKQLAYLALSGIAFLFLSFGGLYLYINSTCATASDLTEVKAVAKETRSEILGELKSLRTEVRELTTKVDILVAKQQKP